MEFYSLCLVQGLQAIGHLVGCDIPRFFQLLLGPEGIQWDRPRLQLVYFVMVHLAGNSHTLSSTGTIPASVSRLSYNSRGFDYCSWGSTGEHGLIPITLCAV